MNREQFMAVTSEQLKKDLTSQEAAIREFESGATRNVDEDQLDYEAFLHPLVLKVYAEYMHEHAVQADGTRRPGDNWQKGIPVDSYASSLARHHMDVWLNHRGYGNHAREKLSKALCGVLFNAMGWLYEIHREDW